jgi:hypothetical protein
VRDRFLSTASDTSPAISTVLASLAEAPVTETGAATSGLWAVPELTPHSESHTCNYRSGTAESDPLGQEAVRAANVVVVGDDLLDHHLLHTHPLGEL